VQQKEQAMNSEMSFEQVWDLLRRELASPKTIRNWTVDRGYLDRGDFTAQADDTHIVCTLSSKSVIRVPRKDVDTVYKIWSHYLSRKIPRHKIRDMARHSKYIISILYQVYLSSIHGSRSTYTRQPG
jgi:hypothetical protein